MLSRLPLALAFLIAPAHAWNEARVDFTVITEDGRMLAISSELSPLEINRMHNWRLWLTDGAGAPVAGARFEVQGGMPEHDHGLPTRPEVTGEIEPGVYLLQGLRFHMPGRWLIEFGIGLEEDADSASLELEL